jgi:hypothetical protein
MGDLVLAEEEAHSLGEPLGDLARALHRLRQIRRDLADLHAELLRVPETGEEGGALQQRLRRNTADIEAHAAEELVLHTRRAVTELRRLDRRDIARRPRADHYDVKAVLRQVSPQSLKTFSGFFAERRQGSEEGAKGEGAGGRKGE